MRVARPKDYESIAQSGLVVPDELAPEEEQISVDFTDISSREVGAILSRFAVRHSYAIFTLAKAKVALLTTKRSLKLAQARYRIDHSDDASKKFQQDAQMATSKRIKKLEDKILELEIEVKLIEAVAEGYEDIRNAASREIERRKAEKAQG